MFLFFLIYFVLALGQRISCEATGSDSSSWPIISISLGDKKRLHEGKNLIYVISGSHDFLTWSINRLQSSFESVAFKSLQCMNITAGSISSPIQSLRNFHANEISRIAKDANRPKVIAVYNVEKVAVNELKRLDFLFAMTDHSFEHTSTLVILAWNTDDRPLTDEETKLHSDDGDDMDSRSDGHRFSLRDYLSAEWSKGGLLVNGEALVGRLTATAHCPACYKSSEGYRGTSPTHIKVPSSPLMDCLLRKDELEQLDAHLFLGEKRRTEYLIAAVALFVMFIVWTYLLPKHKNVVKVESPPHGAWTPLSDLRASETIRNIATAESECMASGVVGTLDSAACGTLDGSEPAVEGSEPSDRAVSAEPAETDSLLQARKRAPRTSVPGTSPSRPNTRSRCKD